jgi:hypothetical protein
MAGSGYGRASVPTSVPKPTRSLPQFSIAADIIAIENAGRDCMRGPLDATALDFVLLLAISRNRSRSRQVCLSRCGQPAQTFNS